jgi:short-subunit dehydrogenase involved in D-alanine esterification of teichoic acids
MFSDRVLAGKKILITGGGSGIGKSLGSRFLELGAEIVICGRREEVLKGTVAEWTTSGGKASYVVCDVRLPDNVDAMFNEIWLDRPLDGSSITRRATSSRAPKHCHRAHSTPS